MLGNHVGFDKRCAKISQVSTESRLKDRVNCMHAVDFRSDTVTQPTPEMRKAMSTAKVGDDVMGEDPTVTELEKMGADFFSKEAGLFVSSGTMGNLVALLAHCQRGDEIILGDKSHIVRGEAGGASTLGGISIRTVRNNHRGMVDLNEVEAAINPNDPHYARTRLISLENTHNSCGGSVLTPQDTASITEIAKHHDILVHIDGARIFNSSVYLKTPVSELTKDVDSVTFCLSKGLSAPVGSVLCGTRETIEKARRWRKALGGGMRQAGIIAAAGIVALKTMVTRLSDDHANAISLAQGLSKIPGIEINPEEVQTNLVFFKVNSISEIEIAQQLNKRGIKVQPRKPRWRLATHYGITSADIKYSLKVFKEVLSDQVNHI